MRVFPRPGSIRQGSSFRAGLCWFAGGGLLVALGILLPACFGRDHSTYVCAQCHAWRQVSQWRAGLVDASIPLSPRSEEVWLSAFAREVAGDHEHTWRCVGGYARGRLSCSRLPRNDFIEAYLDDPEVGRLVQDLLRSGQATREDALRLASVDDLLQLGPHAEELEALSPGARLLWERVREWPDRRSRSSRP